MYIYTTQHDSCYVTLINALHSTDAMQHAERATDIHELYQKEAFTFEGGACRQYHTRTQFSRLCVYTHEFVRMYVYACARHTRICTHIFIYIYTS